MRWLVAALVLGGCSVHGGPAAEAWDPFDGGVASPPAPPAPEPDRFGTPFDAAPAPVTDAGCPGTYPGDGTACARPAERQVCDYVGHGGVRAMCECRRLTPESDDLWSCHRQVK